MLLVLYLRTLCLSKGHKDFSPMFSPRSAMVFGFIFRSMIHLSPGDILDIRGSIFARHSGWGKRFNPPLVGQEQDPGEALPHRIFKCPAKHSHGQIVYNHIGVHLALISKYQKL